MPSNARRKVAICRPALQQKSCAVRLRKPSCLTAESAAATGDDGRSPRAIAAPARIQVEFGQRAKSPRVRDVSRTDARPSRSLLISRAVSVTPRTSITCLPGMRNAHAVTVVPRPAGSSIVPSASGAKSLTTIRGLAARGPARRRPAADRAPRVTLACARLIAQAELDRRADVGCRAGVVDHGLVLARRVDFDVPGDRVVGAGPVAEERAVRRRGAALDVAVRHAVAGRQHGGGKLAIADRERAALRASVPTSTSRFQSATACASCAGDFRLLAADTSLVLARDRPSCRTACRRRRADTAGCAR